MTWTKKEIIEGIKCEKCMEERTFGNIPDSSPENLYLYKDLGGNTRCFCIEHMTFFTKDGAMTNHKDNESNVGYGAELKSKILKIIK